MKKLWLFITAILLITLSACDVSSIEYLLYSETTNQTLYVSQTTGLNLITKKNNIEETLDYTITSDNLDVLSITNKIVTAVSVGTAKVTVTLIDDPNVSIEINITVVPSIVFDNIPSSTELEIDEEVTIVVVDRSNVGSQSITWTSSNQDVLVVTNGTVTAVGAGTAVIRATSNTTGHFVEQSFTVNEAIIVNTYEIQPSITSLNIIEDQEITPQFITKRNGVVESLPYTLSISDNSLASINGLKLRGLMVGSATITATLIDDPSVSTTIEIKIDKSFEIVDLEDTYTMYVNDSLTFTAIDRADISSQGVRWAVNQQTLATVSNGTVTSRLAGTITVTATSNTTNKRITIQITIIERPIEEISLDLPTDEILVESEFSLIAQVYPINATQGLIYTSNNETIAKVDANGLVKTFRSGSVTITARSTVDTSKTFAISFQVSVDPMGLFERFHVESPLRQYVTTFGYNPDRRFQWVNGSVTQYFFSDLNLKQMIIPVNTNPYVGQKATPHILSVVEPMNRIRSGILHEETKHIIYHDTGNHSPGATAYMHANYITSADNANNRARSWHFTVDDNEIYQHIPTNEVAWQGDSYTAYAKGIGIETAVNFGSDLYTTWHRTGKLIASLLIQYNLGMDSILQHYDTSGKNCPQALRMSGLYDEAIDLARAEYIVARDLSQYTIKFTSLNPDYVDERGRVIKAPATATRVGYKIDITGPSYQESKVFYSVLTGVDGSNTVTFTGTEEDIQVAKEFDAKVAELPKTIALQHSAMIEATRAFYNGLTPTQKALTVAEYSLSIKELELHKLLAINTPVVINQVLVSSNMMLNNGFIELYNPTSSDINLSGYSLQYADANEAFSTASGDEYIKWYQFTSLDVIKSKGYFLIQILGSDEVTDVFLPIPDAMTQFNVKSNGKIALSKTLDAIAGPLDTNIVDMVGFGNVSIYEGNGGANALLDQQSSKRIQFIDTNSNDKDFIYSTATPTNSRNQTIRTNLSSDQMAAMEVDLRIIGLPSVLTLEDENQVVLAREQFQLLTPSQRLLVQYSSRLNEKELELEGLMSEDLKMINQAIALVPSKIVFDFNFPTNGGVTWSYKDGEDSSYFDLSTGTYLQLSLVAQVRTLVASLNSESKEITVNFGVTNPNDVLIYNTARITPAAGGSTAEGKGTYEEQASRVGFGGFAITVGNKSYFIGKDSYIPLTNPLFGHTLTREELRPLGGVNGVNNMGLVNGAPTEYNGTGALYYNTTDEDLVFDPSDTYGRNNSGAYGYFKVVFSPNSDGSYTVKTGWADSGQNESTQGRMESLKPGEFLWCPHTYETNQADNAGTWLIQPGNFTIGGVLVPGTTIYIQQFKTNF